MSFIRWGSEYEFVDSEEKSDSYVYPTNDGIEFMSLSRKGLVELLARHATAQDDDYLMALTKKVADMLDVKLRESVIKGK